MSTVVVGRVVDESQHGVSGLAVTIRCESDLFPSDLATGSTDGNGDFSVTIGVDHMTDVFGTRTLGVYVRTGVLVNGVPKGRLLYSDSFPDDPGSTLTVPPIALRAADVRGWPVSLPGTTNALPVRDGNALRHLIDNKLAWGHLADAMRGAQLDIGIMQLELDLPKKFNADPTQEAPEIVLGFPDIFDGDNPPTTANDPVEFPRPERLLLAAAAAGRQVRVMMPRSSNWLARLVLPGAAKVQKYFTDAGSSAKALTFLTDGFSVVHAKTAFIDVVPGAANPECIILGSPFNQSYYDTANHAVFDARRGSCSGEPIPVHDVSLGIRGPVLADLQAQFVAHWNKYCSPADQMQPLTPVPAALTTAASGEYLASVQLVRTVNHNHLPGLPDGELGVLEAYLRAIEKATDYIYIENQYFTNQTIGDALIGALCDPSRPNLQVILLVNIVPDIPFYPTWQAKLISRIRDEIGSAAAARFGVFTRWSHDAAAPRHDHPNPTIMPNYLHSKTAIVDGKWATIGSGNLDGASLDEFQVLRALIGVNRNDELNLLVFNDPADGFPQTDFVDQLRIELWSEHLGLMTTDPRLSAASLASGGWLPLWNATATATLSDLIQHPDTVNPANGHVLAFPIDMPLEFDDYLRGSKIGGDQVNLQLLDLVEHTTAFDFHAGKWSDA